jgi:hypothetical protein
MLTLTGLLAQVVAIEDVFQLASLSQYELYSMARGTYAQLKVAAVQTNDDAKEEECQTDEVSAAAGEQHVPFMTTACMHQSSRSPGQGALIRMLPHSTCHAGPQPDPVMPGA